MLRRLETCLMLAAIAVSVLGAGDQETIHAGPVYTTLTVFPEVRVLVTVPPTAKPETLKPESFSLKVDNGPASPGTVVQTLADSGLGMAAVVLLDVSGSMAGGPLNAIRAGLVKFTSEATLGDRVAICTVADETRWDANWNDTPDQLKTALAALKTRGSLTRLWDGLMEALGKFPETPLARRLVVISDGHDEGSQHTLDEVIAAAGQQRVVVDSIGMTRSDPKFLSNLARLSSATGGLHRPAPSLTILEQLVGGGIKRYRTIPVVTFRAQGVSPDGKAHPFTVSWNGSGAELQSQVEAQVPEDPKPSAETAASVEPPAPSSETRTLLERIPKLWLYVGGGVLAALVLGLVAILALRKREPSVKPPAFQPPQPVYQPGPFPQQAPQSFHTGPFGQAPPMSVSAPMHPESMSVFMPLPPEPEPIPVPPPQPPQPVRSPTWFQAPAKLNPSAWLVCIEGAAAGKSFPIDEAQFWIGANPNNHLVLADDPTVSGNHACIAFENESLGIYDHRSTNGLFLNDERLTEARRMLQVGDKLRVGRSIFVLRPHDAA